VERAAFRVAQLALDNVIRHAPGSTVLVGVTASAGAVRLRIADDGDGPPVDEAAAMRTGRRGIADMRAEARACAASLELGRGAGGRGTTVELRWPQSTGG
jgi:signal transduction histidine kinase